MTIVESVGWVLVHFVWQGVAIALALAAVLSLTTTAQARLRYALSCAALLLMLGAAVATTAHVMSGGRSPLRALPAAIGLETGLAEPESVRVEPETIPLTPESVRREPVTPTTMAPARATAGGSLVSLRPILIAAMPWLVGMWAIGVLLLSIRLVGGWWRTRRLRVEGVGPVPEWCQAQLAAVAGRLRVARPVAILASVRVRVPIVLGHIKPVVLVPASVLAGLSAVELEAIIAHELAHVRRHDYLVNLAQTVIETLLFYHPAVWWVSRQIRDAREQCCDDLAVGVCGNRQSYVHALLGLEEIKRSELLALGATDGPLLARARRLLVPPDRDAAAPRLAAGVIALMVVTVAAAGASFAAGEIVPQDVAVAPQVAASPATSATNVVREQRAAAPVQDIPSSSVVTAPDPAGPLVARWTWADRAARDTGRSRYWIGYTISPVQALPPYVYMDSDARILGREISLTGTFFSNDASDFRFPGRRLVVSGSDRLVKLLLSFDARRGAAVLTGIHASSLALPVDTRDLPIYWLGAADAAGSQAQIERLYKAAGTIRLQNDLIAAIGMHDASPSVVAWLEDRVNSGDPDDLRAEATEWIAYHPIPRSLTALNHIARADRVSRVRQEAAEALGDLPMPEAAPVLIALAHELPDIEARREAVEALGERPEPAAVQALESIARQDPSVDIQREAVETLGDLSGNRGMAIVIELARTHPDVNVRREAIETLGDSEPTEELARLLKSFALKDEHQDVQEEAVETLAGLNRADTLTTLIELATSEGNRRLRLAAVEALANRASDHHDGPSAGDRRTVLDVLSTLAKVDGDREIQRKAIEALGDVPGLDAIARLRDVIGTHPDEDLRATAVEALGDHGSPADVAAILKGIALNDKSERVAAEAIEALADLEDGGGIAALTDIVREQADGTIRRRALEALIDSDDPRARELFRTLRGRRDP